MRDSLIDLLNRLLKEYFSYVPLDTVIKLADELLQNGVLKYPCKVGDEVFYVNGKYYDDIVKCKVVELSQDENRRTIKTQSWDVCVPGLLQRHDRWYDEADFGKEVFLDKDKARAELKARKQNETVES